MSQSIHERFELHTRIQTDLLGEVWRAIARDPPGPARVRILCGSGLSEPPIRDLTFELAQRAARVRHPSLPDPIHADIDAESGAVYLATVWPDGETLGARLRREGRISFAEGVRLAHEVAAVLEAAWHSERLVHAHLTIDRIHLWPEGRVGVLELGTTVVEALARTERTEWLLRLLRASPHYVAPELVRGGSLVDVRTDIYALGAILYQVWTGRLPFGESPAAEALDKHLMGFLDDPCELNPDLPLAAGWMLERWMSRNPDRRPAAWSAVREDLESVMRDRPPGGDRLPAEASVIRRGARRDPLLARQLKRPATFARRSRRRLRSPSGGRNITLPSTPPCSAPSSIARSGGNDFARVVMIALLLLGGVVWLMRDHLREIVQPAPAPHVTTPSDQPPVRDTTSALQEPSVPVPPPITLEDILEMRPLVSRRAPSTPSFSNETHVASTSPVRSPRNDNHNGENHLPDAFTSDPRFQQAAQMFNESLRLFRQYQQVSQPALLDRVEDLAEEAARLFEEVAENFPQDRRIRKYAEQCYGMVRYARQTRLSDGHLRSRDRTRPTRSPHRAPLPAPPSSVAPPASPSGASAPAVGPSARPRTLALAPDWNAPLRVDAGVAEELIEMI